MFRAAPCPSSGDTVVFVRHFVLVIRKQVDSFRITCNKMKGVRGQLECDGTRA